MRKQAEKRKAELLQRLQAHFGKPKSAEVLEAERVIAELNQREKDRIAQLQRAQSPLPADDACPDCFVKGGITSHMKPIPADGNAPDADLFKCKACGAVIKVIP